MIVLNPDLIEKVTKMVLEKLQSQSSNNQDHIEPSNSTVIVKLWNKERDRQNPNKSPMIVEEENKTKKSEPLINLRNNKDIREKENSPYINNEKKDFKNKRMIGIKNPFNKDELENLMSKTPARIGVGRAGLRPKTEFWLKFRFDHAAAVDAVYGDVNEELLRRLNLFKVHTKVTDKETYIRRPDFGRKLSDEAKQIIEQKCKKSPTVQIIVSDGLSSKAILKNLEDVYLSLQQSLIAAQIDIGTPFYIEKGRVAVMDDVGEILNPKVVVLLIGERPGLVSAESLSAYLCYEPRQGTLEADRMVISNIHKGGIPPVEAGAFLGTVVQKILKYKASGISLVQKET
jgi:ethanolamine ammonia-lyase small subunit